MNRKNRYLPFLIVLLLATAYFADWSDDYSSYWNASRYRTFQVANGVPASISGGGGYDALPALFASQSAGSALTNKKSLTGQQDTSVLSAVFGDPLGDSSSSSASASGDSSGRLSMQGSRMRVGDQRSAFGSGMGTQSVTGSMNGMGAGSSGGFGAATTGLGFAGGSGFMGGNQ